MTDAVARVIVIAVVAVSCVLLSVVVWAPLRGGLGAGLAVLVLITMDAAFVVGALLGVRFALDRVRR